MVAINLKWLSSTLPIKCISSDRLSHLLQVLASPQGYMNSLWYRSNLRDQDVPKVGNSTYAWWLPPSREYSPNCFISDEVLVRRLTSLKQALCVMKEMSTGEVSEPGSLLRCCDMSAFCLLPHVLHRGASFPLLDWQEFCLAWPLNTEVKGDGTEQGLLPKTNPNHSQAGNFRMEWTGMQLHSKECYTLLINTDKNKDCINIGKVQTAESECQSACYDG